MEINQIRYVIRVAEQRSFSKAAQDLSVSQPTLTQQISKLEAELGVSLFNRTTRSVSLTEAGADFVSYALRIIDDIDTLNDIMRKHTMLSFDSLHIGIMPHIALFNLPKYISRYFSYNDNISINISQASSEELASELLENKLDVIFIDVQELTDWMKSMLDIRFLKNEPILLAMSKDNHLSSYESIRISDLESCSFWRLHSFESVNSIIEQAFYRVGLSYRFSRNFYSVSDLFDELAGTNAVSFIPRSLCTTHNSSICFKEVTPPLNCTLAIAVSKKQASSKAALMFINYVSTKINSGSKDGV